MCIPYMYITYSHCYLDLPPTERKKSFLDVYQQQHCLRLRLLQHQQYSSIAASVQQHHYSMTAQKHSATNFWFPLPFSLLLLCLWEFWCNPRILLIISFSATYKHTSNLIWVQLLNIWCHKCIHHKNQIFNLKSPLKKRC